LYFLRIRNGDKSTAVTRIASTEVPY